MGENSNDLPGESIDAAYQHVWVEGKWYRTEGRWGEDRDDHCALCKCIRYIHLPSKNGVERLLGYKRSTQFFQKEPSCWGSRQPA